MSNASANFENHQPPTGDPSATYLGRCDSGRRANAGEHGRRVNHDSPSTAGGKRQVREKASDLSITHSISAVARRYGVSQRTVRQWIADGDLIAVNVSRRRGSGRPRLRVTPRALADFETIRQTQPIEPRKHPDRSATLRRRRAVPEYI